MDKIFLVIIFGDSYLNLTHIKIRISYFINLALKFEFSPLPLIQSKWACQT